MSDILPTKSEWAKRIRACWQQSVHSILETRGLTGQRLPNRRGHELLNFEYDGIGYTAGVGGFADGGVAEISLNTAKHGTARDAAVAASLLLQHGCQVDTLRRAHSDGPASGPLAKALNLLAEK